MRLLPVALLCVPLLTPAVAQLLPPNQAGIAMGHVHLNVRSIEAQQKFWVEQFGATVVRSGVKLPGMLILFQQREATGGTEGTVVDHLGLKVRSLAETLARLRAAGFAIRREFTGRNRLLVWVAQRPRRR